MKPLENKYVVITGGASGIGQKMALQFASQKANLAVVDIDENWLAGTEAFSGAIPTALRGVDEYNLTMRASNKV